MTMKPCRRQPQDSSPCLRASARSVLTGRRPDVRRMGGVSVVWYGRNWRAAEDVRPYQAPRHDHTHGRARRPRRAAYAKTPTGTPRTRGRPRTSAPTRLRAMSAHMVGRDVPGAPRTRRRPRGRHGHAGGRGRPPLPRSRLLAGSRPCTLAKTDCGVARYSGRRSHIGLCQNCVCEASAFQRRTPTRRPRQARPSRVAHGRARRPRRAVYAKTPTGTPRTRGRPRTSAPTRKNASVYSVTGRRPFCVFCGKKRRADATERVPPVGKRKGLPEGGGLCPNGSGEG